MQETRIRRSVCISLAGHTLAAILHGALGAATQSWWFITLCAYYLVLCIMRAALLRRYSDDTAPQSTRFTGVMFIFLAVCLTGTVILAAVTDRGRKYHQIITIALALWVFIKLTLALIHLHHARRRALPVIRALRNISLAEALVSLCSLQRTMLATFPGTSPQTVQLMNALTGGAVCIIIFLLGLNLIGGKRITMAKSKLVKANEKIEKAVVDGYKNIENAVVGGYKKVENSVVGAYAKVEDKFIDKYLTREGETVEEAKARLKNEQK